MYQDDTPPRIDEATALDLDLDGVFQALDSTQSAPGRSVLHGWLRNPCGSGDDLADRRSLVGFFRAHPEDRRKAQQVLGRLGAQAQGDLFDFLWNPTETPYRNWAVPIRGLAVAEVLLFAASFWAGGALLVFVALCLVNLGIYLKTTKAIGAQTGSVAYLAKVLSAARRLAPVIPPDTDDRRGLDRGAALHGRIPLTVGLFLPSTHLGGDLVSALFEYYRIFFLGEIRSYLAFHRALGTHREELRRTVELVGKVDASLAVAALEEGEGPVTAPRFTPGRHLRAVGLVHPLVDSCVPLTVSLDRGAVVTGSNMAGKSTFLRTLGVNQVLATGLGIALAAEFETSFARVLTALEITDDLASGQSRYLAQAQRILAVVDACGREPVLALIDEILSGTNSRDRIQASVAILRHLASTPALVVASTHDREIAVALEDCCTPLYFSEMTDAPGLEFDYQVHQGIVDRSNALRILTHLGFGPYLNPPETSP